MLRAIQFDDQSRAQAGKVGDVRTERHLAAEFVVSEPAVAEQVPQHPLVIGLAKPELSGEVLESG
jgi:hypothetical protein